MTEFYTKYKVGDTLFYRNSQFKISSGKVTQVTVVMTKDFFKETYRLTTRFTEGFTDKDVDDVFSDKEELVTKMTQHFFGSNYKTTKLHDNIPT